MNILYFASIREAIGTAEETISDLNDPSSVQDILDQLIERGEPWRTALSNQTLLTALNQEIVTPETIVSPGDELAIMPPVTGG